MDARLSGNIRRKNVRTGNCRIGLFYGRTSMESYNLASKIVKSIQSRRKRIPLYDENGKLTGRNFRIIKLNARNIDVGVTQIQISWKTHTAYDEETYTKASRFFYDGLPASQRE